MKPISLFLLICFFAAIVCDVILNKLGTTPNQYLIKGALIPLLVTSFILEIIEDGNKFSSIRIILAALLFCFIGDLIWVDFKPRTNFAFGTAAFVIASLLFAWFFYKQRPFKNKSAVILFIVTLFLLATGIGLVYFMWKRLELQNMVAPVIIYVAVMELMLLCSINITTSRRLKKTGVIFFVPGAACFFSSQLMILLNRFYSVNNLFALLYLLLYGTGLFLIVRGATLTLTTRKLN